jgi:hypothetical protein
MSASHPSNSIAMTFVYHAKIGWHKLENGKLGNNKAGYMEGGIDAHRVFDRY